MSGKKTRPQPGLVQTFSVGAHAEVEAALVDLKRLGVRQLRTEIRRRTCQTAEGQRWYQWLLERLGRELEVIPSFREAPVASDAPSGRSPGLGSFLDDFLGRFGTRFEWVAVDLDARELAWEDLSQLAPRLSALAKKAEERGRKIALTGIDARRPAWLERMISRDGIGAFDALGLQRIQHSDSGPLDSWEALLRPFRQVLEETRSGCELWVADAGYATSGHDEARQLNAFVDVLSAPAERVFWRALRDAEAEDEEELEEGMGLRRADGSERILMRLWQAEGIDGVVRAQRAFGRKRRGNDGEGRVVIFGGAGFIGSNLANRLLEDGRRVRVVDNLSRPSVEKNLRWLLDRHGERLEVQLADTRDARAVRRAVEGAEQVFHFAAQVAVTTSLTGPVHDFEVNARGTLNVLEAIRAMEHRPSLLFTSTNKVYGGLPDVPMVQAGQRYQPADPKLVEHGLSEARPLDFESPYGCSKGCADQYVLDYARSYGINSVVFRMSCIYGPRQFGTEDQGWVAHFLIRALSGQPITLYGDGMQVRDILFVEDLVRAFITAHEQIDKTAGQAFNIGGGPERTISLLELLDLIEHKIGRRPEVSFEDWRTGDQRYYVSDTRKFTRTTGWRQQVGVEEGVTRLLAWLQELRGEPKQHKTLEPAEVRAG